MSSIQILHWESNDIPRRSDGYFNATAMCQAGGKLWGGWWRLQSTQDLIQALSAAMQIPTTELVQSVSGGTPHLQGTWVHPQVAIALAMWIAPAFAAWCMGVLHQVVEPAPAIPEGDLARVKARVEGNKGVARVAVQCGVAPRIAHDQRTVAISGRRTKHWKEMSGHDMWQECLPTEQQAVMALASIMHSKGMTQAHAAGLEGMATLSKANENVRNLREVISPVFTPGQLFTFQPGTSRVNQLKTVENRDKKFKAQRKPKEQQPTFPSLFD
jgi:hypothetical protein